MIERELSEVKNLDDWEEIPRILNKQDHILWKLSDAPHRGRDGDSYLIELVEFHKGKAMIRTKSTGTWKKGYTVSFDTRDYVFKEKQEYMVKITIYINMGREVSDSVYIKL